jgi:hypothetical protein
MMARDLKPPLLVFRELQSERKEGREKMVAKRKDFDTSKAYTHTHTHGGSLIFYINSWKSSFFTFGRVFGCCITNLEKARLMFILWK